jgi:hypothetical protein
LGAKDSPKASSFDQQKNVAGLRKLTCYKRSELRFSFLRDERFLPNDYFDQDFDIRAKDKPHVRELIAASYTGSSADKKRTAC